VGACRALASTGVDLESGARAAMATMTAAPASTIAAIAALALLLAVRIPWSAEVLPVG